MTNGIFTIAHRDVTSKARAGILHTKSGDVETPFLTLACLIFRYHPYLNNDSILFILFYFRISDWNYHINNS